MIFQKAYYYIKIVQNTKKVCQNIMENIAYIAKFNKNKLKEMS